MSVERIGIHCRYLLLTQISEYMPKKPKSKIIISSMGLIEKHHHHISMIIMNPTCNEIFVANVHFLHVGTLQKHQGRWVPILLASTFSWLSTWNLISLEHINVPVRRSRRIRIRIRIQIHVVVNLMNAFAETKVGNDDDNSATECRYQIFWTHADDRSADGAKMPREGSEITD